MCTNDFSFILCLASLPHRLLRVKQGNAWDKSCLMTKPMHHGKNHAVWVLPCHDLSHGGIAKPMDLICCYGMSFAMPSPFPWGYNNTHECHTLVYPWFLRYSNPIWFSWMKHIIIVNSDRSSCRYDFLLHLGQASVIFHFGKEIWLAKSRFSFRYWKWGGSVKKSTLYLLRYKEKGKRV